MCWRTSSWIAAALGTAALLIAWPRPAAAAPILCMQVSFANPDAGLPARLDVCVGGDQPAPFDATSPVTRLGITPRAASPIVSIPIPPLPRSWPEGTGLGVPGADTGTTPLRVVALPPAGLSSAPTLLPMPAFSLSGAPAAGPVAPVTVQLMRVGPYVFATPPSNTIQVIQFAPGWVTVRSLDPAQPVAVSLPLP